MRDLRDFPDFLSPVLVKELRQGVRAKSFLAPFIVVQVAMLIALGFDGFASVDAAPSPTSLFFPGLRDLQSNQGAFWLFLFPLMIFAVPYRGLQAVDSEKDERNGELILLTRLTRWKIIMGKWIALCALGMVTLVSCLPYLVARYFLGGMNVPGTFFLFGLVTLANITTNALAIGISGFTLGKRVLLLVFAIPIMLIGALMGSAGTARFLESAGLAEFGFTTALLMLAGLSTVALFYSLSWLQVGRAKLRLFEDPLVGSASGSMLTLFFCSPVIFGIFGAITMGWGIIPSFLLMSFVVAMVDPAPKQSKAVPYGGAYSH